MFFNKLENYRDNICVIDPIHGALSYGEIVKKCDGVEQRLREQGRAKKLVFIEAHNNLSTIVAYLGAMRAGHAVHMIDPCKKNDNAALIGTYQPHFIIKCDDSNGEVVSSNNNAIDIVNDLCLLLSTSGSTGSKKLVKISYSSIQDNTEAINAYLENTETDRAITSLKLHYSYGISVLNTILDVGGSIVVNNNSAFEPTFWESLNRHNVTCFSGVPHHFSTFEKLGLEWTNYKSLRYVTQAGGKLSPSVIKKHAKQCMRNHIKFFVMYGQTEASPRMSYVPPECVIENADCIGRAINGGAFRLLDEYGAAIEGNNIIGELAYTGKNIMSGYATSQADLAVLEDIKQLKTGDLALRNVSGYYQIVGRKARFVKPLGIRINLDDIEQYLHGVDNDLYVVGNDQKILIVHTRAAGIDIDVKALAQKYNLPESLFVVKEVKQTPLLANGKIDYKYLENLLVPDRRCFTWYLGFINSLCVHSFFGFFAILCGSTRQWTSVEDVFKENFPHSKITKEDSFLSLGGDSLRYVGTSLGLETLFTTLPKNWYELPISDLESMRQAADV